jgi:hypothetical protein
VNCGDKSVNDMRHSADMTSVQALILVTGASSGLGKSSLAEALARRLEGAGRRTSHFREEDIRTDPAFRGVMDAFETTGVVGLETLLDAAETYLRDVRRRPVDVVVLDALFPYLPSLLAWGHADDDIARFFDRMAVLFAPFTVIELHLVGDTRAGLARAAEREGAEWLDGHVAKVARYAGAPSISGAAGAGAVLADHAARSRRLLEAAPWRVELVDSDAGRAAAVDHALAVVASALGAT